MDSQQVDKKFYEMINSEDWNLDSDDAVYTIPELPVGEVILPSPIPGLWFRLYLGFNIEEPGEFYG